MQTAQVLEKSGWSSAGFKVRHSPAQTIHKQVMLAALYGHGEK